MIQRQWKRGLPARGNNWRGKPKMNGFWFPGRLEVETTRDLPDPHRFRVKGKKLDYVIGKQYQEYIEQCNKPKRWKVLAWSWLRKLYEANGMTL